MSASSELLPELDREYLGEKGFDFEITPESGNLKLTIRSFQFPGYVPETADLLVIIPAGYPNAQLDMFWTHPDVKLRSGAWPQNAEHHEDHAGRTWQRWSRHNTQGWRSGVDSLRTFLAAVRKEIAKGI